MQSFPINFQFCCFLPSPLTPKFALFIRDSLNAFLWNGVYARVLFVYVDSGRGSAMTKTAMFDVHTSLLSFCSFLSLSFSQYFSSRYHLLVGMIIYFRFSFHHFSANSFFLLLEKPFFLCLSYFLFFVEKLSLHNLMSTKYVCICTGSLLSC